MHQPLPNPTTQHHTSGMSRSAQRSKVKRAGSKRRRSSYSCAASSLARKQPKTSTTASPSATKPSRAAPEDDSSKPSPAKSCSSMKDTIESHINASLSSWLADPLIKPESQPLDPLTTYIYMQLDLDDPTSYVAVPLPPSLVAQITALSLPYSSPESSTTKEDTDSLSSLSTLSSQIDTKTTSFSLMTPPQTPPRVSA